MKQQPLSLSSLMVLLVSGVAAITVLISTLVYTTLYANALRSNAAASSEQSVAQAAGAISDYTSDASTLIRRITGELQSEADDLTLAETFSTMVQMRDDLTSIGVYTSSGRLLSCWTHAQAAGRLARPYRRRARPLRPVLYPSACTEPVC